MSEDRLQHVISLIDAANGQDPNIAIDENGAVTTKELLYSLRMTRCQEHFAPDASEPLKIAARAQHIERWKSPRSDYPEGRTGYKKWRAELGLFHATRTGELMLQAGYPEDDIDTVKYLLQKRQLKKNPETQALEDIICLVFLEYYLEDFAAKHTEEKVIDITQKTWKKMSGNGQDAALTLPLSEKMQKLVGQALNNL